MTATIQHLRCRSCGAPITWTTTEGGERMPCDAHPVAGGNIRLLPGAPGEPPTSRVTPGGMVDMFDPTDDGVRYLAHFVNCPDADEWRSA